MRCWVSLHFELKIHLIGIPALTNVIRKCLHSKFLIPTIWKSNRRFQTLTQLPRVCPVLGSLSWCEALYCIINLQYSIENMHSGSDKVRVQCKEIKTSEIDLNSIQPKSNLFVSYLECGTQKFFRAPLSCDFHTLF